MKLPTGSCKIVEGSGGAYCVDIDGSIYSRLGVANAKETGGFCSFLSDAWFPMKPWLNRKGYPVVGLRIGGKSVRVLLGRLVLTVFRGPAPQTGMQCCHNDGVPANSALSNLRWDTAAGNENDKLLHGTRLVGSRINFAKLTEKQVEEIISARSRGARADDLAKQFGVSIWTIFKISSGKTWKHVVRKEAA